MPPCPPQQGRTRTMLLPQPVGEPGPTREIELAWQEIMSITELEGLDVQNENAYDTAIYCNMMPGTNYGLSQTTADDSLPSCSQNLPVYNRQFPEVMSPQCQRMGAAAIPSMDPNYGPATYTCMLISSPLHQVGPTSTSQLGTKNESMSGLLNDPIVDQLNLMDIGITADSLMSTQACKAQEDLESDSGLSLNYSDAESMEMEGVEHGRLHPEYSELYPVDYHTAQRHYHMLPSLQEVPITQTYSMLPPEASQAFDSHACPRNALIGKAKHCRIEMPINRDERRAMAMKIPFATENIVNLPVDDFNELLSKYQLNEAQLALIRDIRRRGKNKVAAQNCRKRKLETILHLEKDLDKLRNEKEQLFLDRCNFEKTICQMNQKLNDLYQDVFRMLRDNEGHPYSSEDYSLQQTVDGSIFLVPQKREDGIE
ncbi:transcription factor NF-E2 45 kDa subunit [Rhinatrema bivittatum]|uniref:transcription factor NF-E2 45 kDa subunit n=1 Tax=Rhinatrema bivittatum TaxID=194408 RepID=UPI00112D0B26|nr:transcription factor NF-E2 45 kDa subunit [Rhinatrema bivittatum]XP_029451016.1 transcription factor NF-E2 45 kDa subunit [Rhinatrema bivittatum]